MKKSLLLATAVSFMAALSVFHAWAGPLEDAQDQWKKAETFGAAAQVYERAEHLETADRTLQTFLQSQPKHPGALILHLRVLMALAQSTAEMGVGAQDIWQYHNENVEPLYVRARKVADQLIALKSPYSPEAYYWKGQSLIDAGGEGELKKACELKYVLACEALESL